ncbi:hypothetical protein MTR_8g052550 [Medicago truncatula]|uniref:Uncharacterized protein n=1 Tax=Medicago truncatula TaxID=3880 RepID=G7LA10_MEDTR|nr:hypothetical protein MTR_8g052550 [Medicago truncatula]
MVLSSLFHPSFSTLLFNAPKPSHNRTLTVATNNHSPTTSKTINSGSVLDIHNDIKALAKFDGPYWSNLFDSAAPKF